MKGLMIWSVASETQALMVLNPKKLMFPPLQILRKGNHKLYHLLPIHHKKGGTSTLSPVVSRMASSF